MEEKVDKGAILRRFADAGLKEYKIRKALEKYQGGRISELGSHMPHFA